MSDNRINIFRTQCREHGLKATPQRLAIYEELCKSNNHPNAEQVYSKVKKRFPTISLNTVNQTLLTFSQIRLVEIVEGFGNPRRYDPNIKAHHHVHCINCKSILDFNSSQYDNLKIPPSIKSKYDVLALKVVLSGVCSNCR